MNKFLKAVVGICFTLIFSMSHADFSAMNKYYTNSSVAPKVKQCKGDQDCNAFYALSKQWKSIPNCFQTSYGSNCDAKAEAIADMVSPDDLKAMKKHLSKGGKR